MARRRLDPCTRNARKGDKILGSIIGTGLKLATSSNRRSSNSGCMLVLIVMILLSVLISSCSKDNTISDKQESTEESNEQLNESDIAGVWIVNSFSNNPGVWERMPSDLYFLSITDSGFYSFCFSPTLMGSGKYNLKNDSIIFYNEYLQITDTIKIEKVNSTLQIQGNIHQFKSNNTIRINLQLKQSNETPATPIIGEQWESNDILSLGGDQKEYIDVLSQYIIKYRRVKANGIETPVKTQNWFYTNRKDLIYTQISNGDGTIHLYKSPFIYESLTGISSFEIDFDFNIDFKK